ncbi:MAG: serine/threonine protein kinase [Bradymonadia bacterium]|jgi:serine/threonine protein kinase
MTDTLLGGIIGDRYRLIQVVGQGGMGVVYRAEDVRLADRPCAIKLLMGTSMDPDEGLRFERELSIISRLRSQHVVQVLDTGILPDHRRFIVMELLEGLSLQALLKQAGHLAPRRAVKLIKGVLAGLTEAHEWGIIHRDLKPANVFVTQVRTGEEIAKVLDFGIAKDTRGVDADLTHASMLIGTPKYMAPEQFLKNGASTRTDLYAVGLLMYQTLCGRPPFVPQDEVADNIKMMPEEFRVGWLHVHQAPAPLDIDPQLWRILECLLAKSPDERFPEASDVIQALSRWEGLPAAPALPTMIDEPGVSPSQISQISSTTGFPVMGESMSAPIYIAPPRRAGLWVGLAIAGLMVVGGVIWMLQGGPSTSAKPPATAAQANACVHNIDTQPPGAQVMFGIKALGQTPARIERPCREQWLIDISLSGHAGQRFTLKGQNAESKHSFRLTSTAPPSAAPETAAPKSAAPLSKAKTKAKAARKRGRTPRKVAPRKVAPRKVAPLKVAPRKVAPRKVAPREVAPAAKTSPKTAAPAAAPTLPF